MPLFEGKNSDEWIFRAERYFAVNQLAEEEKVESATLCFEAAALAWFQKGATSVSMVKEQLLARDLVLEELKAHLLRAHL